MTKPTFTPEQIAYLQEVLRPGCCHVSGMHDPQHFAKHPERLCEYQMREGYEAVADALGLDLEKDLAAHSSPNCGWCQSAWEQVQNDQDLLRSVKEVPLDVVFRDFLEKVRANREKITEASMVVNWQGDCYRLNIELDQGYHGNYHKPLDWIRIDAPKFTTNQAYDPHHYPQKATNALTEEMIAAALPEWVTADHINASGERGVSAWVYHVGVPDAQPI